MNYFNYFSEIEETFIRRRGKHLLLSPLDWAMIESWQERKVPLHIVLRGIEKVFDSYDAKPKKNRTIKSLMYCQEEIEVQHEEWLERQVGKAESIEQTEETTHSIFSDSSIHEHLAQVSAELQNALEKAENDLKEVLARVLARLADLEKNFSTAESLEDSLSDLEKLIDAVLLESIDKDELAKLNLEVTKNLSSYKTKMEADVFERTFDLMILKRLHERAEIPRLSLFYL